MMKRLWRIGDGPRAAAITVMLVAIVGAGSEPAPADPLLAAPGSASMLDKADDRIGDRACSDPAGSVRPGCGPFQPGGPGDEPGGWARYGPL